jgi:hypothetical protein
VVQSAKLLPIDFPRDEHIFNIVGTIRYFHVDPARHVVARAASPDFGEAEECLCRTCQQQSHLQQ